MDQPGIFRCPPEAASPQVGESTAHSEEETGELEDGPLEMTWPGQHEETVQSAPELWLLSNTQVHRLPLAVRVPDGGEGRGRGYLKR